MNKFIPTGGVKYPNCIVDRNIIPKCIWLISYISAIGNRIGTTRTIAEKMSKIAPRIIKNNNNNIIKVI